MLCYILAVILLLATTTLSQIQYPSATNYINPGTEPPDHALDMLHVRLEVSFTPTEGLVKGKVTHRFRAIRSEVDSFFFNGPGINILKATLNAKPLRYRISSDGITTYFTPSLKWNSIDSITFEYEAHPRKGIYFVGWDDPKNISRKQIWTQGQGIDNRHWFPCYDEQNDKLTTETIITFDKNYRVLSNGTLINVTEHNDGTKTWHYTMLHPHATYLVMIGIGQYEVRTVRSTSGVPIHLWYYPDQPERVDATYMHSAQAVDFMEKETGIPYPWESYAQIPVQDFLYGAMENTTATVFGDFLFVDRRSFLDKNYIAVNVHELAHQWFGDYITGRNGLSAWLHESFATFYPKMFLKSVNGEEYYEWTRRAEQDAALAASKTNRLPILHSQAGGARAYQKGSAVLDMMMYAFGEDDFKRVIHHYLQQHAYGNVETNDFYQAFQDAIGLSPDWFFEEWIYRGGEPHYSVQYDDVLIKNTRRTDIWVHQIHPRDDFVGLFKMPIVFEVHYADGSFDRLRLMVDQESQRITIMNPLKKKIAFVLFDPGSYVLKTVTFEKSFAELQAQALHAPLMIDRYDAVAAMHTIDMNTKRNILAQAFGRETFHYVKEAVIAQLVNDSSDAGRSLVKKGLHDPNVEVRKSVINTIVTIPPAMRTEFETLLTDSSYDVVTAALTKLAVQFPDRLPQYLDITRGVDGMDREVKIRRFELTAATGNNAAIDSLVEYSSGSYDFRSRLNAFDALKRLNYLDEALIGNLFDAMTHWNNRLKNPTTEVAQYFFQQGAYKKLFREYYRSHTWLPYQRAILENFIGN
ncbi:MAG: M1 family metallopeptidase [Ignavibacteriae bacterium]|nr:M1 family metallopeptidase [Ignavibacteriota bacterium]